MPYDPKKRMIQLEPETRKQLKILKGQYDVRTYDEVIHLLLSRKEVIIGHFTDLKKNWFIAWADNPTEAWAIMDTDIECPETDSMKIVEDHGYVLFKVQTDEETPEGKISKNDIKLIPDLEDEEFFFNLDLESIDWIVDRINISDEVIRKRREETNRQWTEMEKNNRNVASYSELMVPEFIKFCSRFSTYEEMMEKGGFEIKDLKDLEKVDMEKLNKFISMYTRYDNWDTFMMASAQIYEWKKRNENLDEIDD